MSRVADVEAVNDGKEPIGIPGADTLTSSLGDTTHIALPPRSPLSFAWPPSARYLDPHAGAGA